VEGKISVRAGFEVVKVVVFYLFYFKYACLAKDKNPLDLDHT